MPLYDGGGYARNNDLNLYFVSQGRFLLVSERDCVQIDALKAILKRCLPAHTDTRTPTRVGRFGWMNGFDPPHGTFRYAFRFLPAWDT